MADLGKYGMGTERSFGDWQEYSGFNYKAGTLDADWEEWEDRAGIVSHGATGRQADGTTNGSLHRGPPDGAAGQGGSGRELQLVGVTRASVEGLALVVHVARELQGNQGAPEHVAPGRGGGMWEGLWE